MFIKNLEKVGPRGKFGKWIRFKCDQCEKEVEINSYSYYENFKNRGKDLCRSCVQREAYRKGIRHECWSKYNKAQKGKTLEERLGSEKAKIAKEKMSKSTSGINNPNYGGKYCRFTADWSYEMRHRTLEEKVGKERAVEIKKKISINTSGKNNPMYGKPSPQGSGNGWSGYYKNFYFRSILELSFILFAEAQHWQIESAENKKHKVEYLNPLGAKANYFPDYLINSCIIAEVKPKKLVNTPKNKAKYEAAKIFFTKQGYTYKIFTEEDFDKILPNKLKQLIESKKVKFIDRYVSKVNQWIKEHTGEI